MYYYAYTIYNTIQFIILLVQYYHAIISDIILSNIYTLSMQYINEYYQYNNIHTILCNNITMIHSN